MNVMLLEPDEVSATGEARVAGVRAKHLVNVLKVVPGDLVRVGVVDGPFGRAVVEALHDVDVALRCTFDPDVPARPVVDLLLALPRPKVLRRLWAQMAAIGVGQIVLTNAARVERCYFDTHVLTKADYRPLLVEGLQQARDTRLPVVSVHKQFKVLVEDDLARLFPQGQRLVADPSAVDGVSSAVRGGAAARVLLAVGPEGGWNGFERERLAAHGFAGVGLGARTLRTDTACIALLSLVHAALRQG